ncbi:MAG TPA: hypothetical protein ENJ63_03915 [Dissulfuribacter thermophilus]|uniref:Uncharacterized protein n=1 Tax=Dissulfuribacter thermophilus TaxID=1156395 RepID=A0A7V2WTC9_9BACT|nr:hypothetical protein [Dissulfuribacter thermophilus]
MMDRQDIAILYSGGRDSLALYAISLMGRLREVPRPNTVHLLHMLNGMGRFPEFPRSRMEVAKTILEAQVPYGHEVPKTAYVELDCGRLFQGLWLDWYEDLMPKFGGKNLVCVACKLAMHTKAIIYAVEHYVPIVYAGYAKRQGYYPEQTDVFMEKMAALSQSFGIKTSFPVYDVFDTEEAVRHFLEAHGLPSTGGGERKCLFCQTKTSATPKEIGDYLDYFAPKIREYIENTLEGRIREATRLFPPGHTA